jgi:hypothetical protein
LFRGVAQIVIQQPNHIRYGGDCQALVTGADAIDLTEAATDLPSPPYLIARPTPLVANDSLETRIVIAISGGLLHDPYTGPTGHRFPGIEPNATFAQNLLRMLSSARRAVSELSMAGDELLREIEQSLLHLVYTVLFRAAGQGWWSATFIPDSIQAKCEGRRESGLPDYGLIDLIDYKKIIRKNWGLFQPHFQAVIRDVSAKSAVAWIQEINDKYRKYVAHETRKIVSGFSFSANDVALLQDYRNRARALRRAAEGTRSS